MSIEVLETSESQKVMDAAVGNGAAVTRHFVWLDWRFKQHQANEFETNREFLRSYVYPKYIEITDKMKAYGYMMRCSCH